MKIRFTSEPKVFTNDQGQSITYIERCIVIDDIAYKVPKVSGQVFDLQFKEYINGPAIEIEVE